MSYKPALFGLFYCLLAGLVAGEPVVEDATKNVTVENTNRQGRSSRDVVYRGLIVCAFRYEAGCFVDVAQNYLDLKRKELLAQADREVARATGSTTAENKPSHVAQTIEKLFADLAGLFREGFSSLFGSKDDDDEVASGDKTKEVEEDDDEDDDDDDDDDKKGDNTSRDVGEARKKKKKKKGPLKKLFTLIKVIIVAAVIFLKVTLLIKIVEAVLKFKLVLVSAGFLILHVVKLWLDQRNKKNHHEEVGGIVYKNPFDGGSNGGAEWAGPGVPGEYHGRSYENEERYGQNLAYNQHIQ